VERHYYIEYLGNAVELPIGETIVGRDVGCRLRFNDPAVSRRHLRFVRRQDEVFVEDLASSNGTLLNGRPVGSPLRIHHDDAIQVGSRTLVVKVADGEGLSSTTLVLVAEAVADAPHGRRTERLATAVAPPSAKPQRCPQCGVAVSEIDDECNACGFTWGGFRAMSHTDVRKGVSRRRHDRHAVELQLVYVSPELEIEAASLDLSPSGVFVCSQVLDPVGTKCRLTILIDGGPPLEIGGIVRRVVEHEDASRDECGLGVEFTNVGPAEQAWLEAVIARRSPGAP
jgi:hypothetical protein